jgi:hypothetical protein
MIKTSGAIQFGAPVKGKSLEVSDRGRVCWAEGCTTLLSVYNHSDHCSLHEPRAIRT